MKRKCDRERFDRSAIMRDAHKRFRDGKRLDLGWSFGQCLVTAWAAAREKRALAEREKAARRIEAALIASGRPCRVAPLAHANVLARTETRSYLRQEG